MINGITNFKYPINVLPPKNSRIISKYNLEKDTVSFSGKMELTPVAEEALSIQSKLHKLYRSNNLSIQTIQEVFNSKSPVPVEIKPISQIPNALKYKDCLAYMQPCYENDLSMKKAIIYLNDNFSDKRNASNIIADCIHEYTHVLQRHKDGDYLRLSKVTNNLEEARFLNFIGAQAMGDTEKSLFNILNSNAQYTNLINKKFKTNTPVTKNDIKPYLPSKEELDKSLNNLLDIRFKKLTEKLSIPQQDLGEYEDFYNKAKPTLKESVIRQFEMEAEAKSADIEARKRGLVFDSRTIFAHSINKSLYEAYLEIMK